MEQYTIVRSYTTKQAPHVILMIDNSYHSMHSSKPGFGGVGRFV